MDYVQDLITFDDDISAPQATPVSLFTQGNTKQLGASPFDYGFSSLLEICCQKRPVSVSPPLSFTSTSSPPTTVTTEDSLLATSPFESIATNTVSNSSSNVSSMPASPTESLTNTSFTSTSSSASSSRLVIDQYQEQIKQIQQKQKIQSIWCANESESLTKLSNIPKSGRLHVSNIPFKFRREHLVRIFSTYGPVYDAEIIFNERGSKGFGFVSFYNPKHAVLAKRELDGYIIDGRKMEVNIATPKPAKTVPKQVTAYFNH